MRKTILTLVSYIGITLIFISIGLKPVRAQVSVADEVIEVRSGTTGIGTRDPNVSYTYLPGYAEKPRVLKPNDFEAATKGSKAWVVTPFPSWLIGLTDDQNAKWVSSQSLSTNEGVSALYAIPFRVEKPINTISFEITLAVDDYVTYQDKVGIFVNGTQLNCDNFAAKGTYNTETFLTCTVVPVNTVKTGNNTLYFLVSNVFGPSGIIFNAKALINPSQPAQSGSSVLAIETQNTYGLSTPSATPSVAPTETPAASPAAQTSNPPAQLPKTGSSLELMLSFIAASIWGYYFYLRFRLK